MALTTEERAYRRKITVKKYLKSHPYDSSSAKAKRDNELRKHKYDNDPEYKNKILSYNRQYSREAQRRRRANPETLAADREKMRLKRLDPEYRERERERRYMRTPEGWAKRAISQAKYRASKKGIVFNISVEDIEIPEYCPVLGMKLVFNNSKTLPDCPSIDRFDNEKGYIKGNIRVISHRANVLKKNASIDEMRRIVMYMEGKI